MTTGDQRCPVRGDWSISTASPRTRQSSPSPSTPEPTAFLYPDECQHRETDVAADDYVTDPNDWRRVRGELPAALLAVIRRTAKEIAHLTTARLNYNAPNREWPVALITETLWAGVKRFTAQASPNRLDAAVRRYLDALELPMTSMRMSVYPTTCTGVTTVSGPSSLTADNFTQG